MTLAEQKFWLLLGLINFVLKLRLEESDLSGGTFLGEGCYDTLVDYECFSDSSSDSSGSRVVGMR